MLAAWPFARQIASGGTGVGIASKGFSVFYQDADNRVWTRIAGVVIAASRRLIRPATLPAQASAA
jgi:hypothetical protein